jgi:hypothetical protein
MERDSGAAEGIRTPDPRITNAVLYRLSYRGYSLRSLRFLSGGDSHSTVLLPDCYPFAAAMPVYRLTQHLVNVGRSIGLHHEPC